MNRRFPVFLLVAVLSALPAGPARASLSLDKSVVEIKLSDRPVDTINVTNNSDKPAKVSVTTLEVVNPDPKNEVDKETTGLIVAPKAFEMQPNETRAVRLVLRDRPADAEAMYRVRFKPSEPSVVKDQVVGATTVHVGIIMSMGALILVSPKNPKPDLQITRAEKVIHLTNKGNVTATLQREDFCTEGKKTCAQLPSLRIYPGTTVDMDVPPELATVDFSQTVLINGNYSKILYARK
jgi:P pilus assembly chaperone PapD